MDPTIDAFLKHLLLAGRDETARGYRPCLVHLGIWLAARQRTPATATHADLLAYQQHLAGDYRSTRGQPLGIGTQATRLAVMKSFFAWLLRRGLIAVDPAAAVQLPRLHAGPVRRDHLTLQEATALLQTKAAGAAQYPEGCARWADEVRDLAYLALSLASGRRRSGIRHLKVQHADFARNELRVEREKGKTGRVVPVAGWAMSVVQAYVEKARPVLNWHHANDWLFVGDREPQMGKNTFAAIVERAHAETIAAHPDLEELADKHLSPHSLRVSFAALLFRGRASLRTINELMQHENLATTARYTPVPIEDLRRTCLRAHPMA